MRSGTSPITSRTLRIQFVTYVTIQERESYLAQVAMLLTILMGATTPVLGQDQATVLARLDGSVITQKDVDDSFASRILPLQQQLYSLRKVALENLITRRLLEGEAARKKISVEEVRRRLMEGPINVTNAQVEAAYLQNSSFFATMSPDEAKERLRLDLETQARMKNYRAALEKLRNAASLVIDLPPPANARSIDEGGSPVQGTKNPVVTIVEFSDFECPFCASVQNTLKQVLREYANFVRLIFKNLPLEMHRHSVVAARAAYCAGKQDRFWPYHDRLFDSRKFEPESLNQIASDLGLALEDFQACLTSPDSFNAITRDIESARRLRIESTPSFVINGSLVSGAISFSDFKKIIDRELQRSSAKASSLN